jgi:hypothetical protein
MKRDDDSPTRLSPTALALMLLVGFIAAFVLLSVTLGPLIEPGRYRRTRHVYALEDGGAVRLYRIEPGPPPRLVPVGPAVKYERPGNRR